MNALLAEWISKAEGDFLPAQREMRVRKNPNHDSLCFHCQQAAEKYLKAFLFQHHVDFPKTHNLIEPLELCLPIDQTFDFQRDLLTQLDRYGVRYRYPGISADKEDAQLALRMVKSLRAFLRVKLGLND